MLPTGGPRGVDDDLEAPEGVDWGGAQMLAQTTLIVDRWAETGTHDAPDPPPSTHGGGGGEVGDHVFHVPVDA
jgi:hypothetical protein